MVNVINESGMDFIVDNAFHIENSMIYKGLGEGVKSVEFVRVVDDTLLFVEAKNTFPNPNNPSEDEPNRFQDEVEDICEKFVHSLNLFLSVEVGVAEDVSANEINKPETVTLVLVLVIKKHEHGWCKPVKFEMERALPSYFTKIWKPNILVINQEEAVELDLVLG